MPRNYRESRWQPERAATDRLAAKYPRDPARVGTVSMDADYGPDPRPHWHSSAPDTGDILAALTLTDSMRRSADYYELHLIAGARARSASWTEIADALGYDNPASATRRYRELHRQYPGYRAPHPDAAQWAAGNEPDLRAAVQVIAGQHRDELAANPHLLGSMVTLADLVAAATTASPADLYWTAYAASRDVHYREPTTPAMQALAALQNLVTEPEERTRR